MGFTVNQNDLLEIKYLDMDHTSQIEFFSGIVSSLDSAKEFVRNDDHSLHLITSITYFIEVMIANDGTPYVRNPARRFNEYLFPTIEAFLRTPVQWVEDQRSAAVIEVQQYLDEQLIPSDD